MDSEDFDGVFPVGNPIPYTGQEELLHSGNTPAPRTWYHGTYSDRVASIATFGLLPSCWFGGDCCCVFGFDEPRFELYSKYGDWFIEVYSRVEAETDLKAWWVPPHHIVGAWNKGIFYKSEQLLMMPGKKISALLSVRSCSDQLCLAQFELYQTKYPSLGWTT